MKTKVPYMCLIKDSVVSLVRRGPHALHRVPSWLQGLTPTHSQHTFVPKRYESEGSSTIVISLVQDVLLEPGLMAISILATPTGLGI